MTVIGVIGYLVRAWLIWRHPVVFGGDTVLRLANPEHVLLSYQLPLPQALVHVLHPLVPGPVLIRHSMAAVGALAGITFYLFATTLVAANVAFAATLFFVTNPMILTHSTVPYQEIFFLGGVLGAFYGAVTNRWYLASASLAVACLARYESWLACPLIGLLYLQRKGWSPRRVIEATLLFGWVPLGWIAYNSGITPPGSFAVEGQVNLERFVRWVYLGYVTLRQTAMPVWIVAALGTWQVWRRRLWHETPAALFVAYIFVFLIAILFSAHGTSPDPERYVTAREAHVLLVGVALLATIGLDRLPRYRWPVAVVCAGTGLWMSDYFLRRASQQADVALSVAAADYLDAQMGPNERAVVLCAPIVGSGAYLKRLEQEHGPEGRAAGIAILNSVDTRPPNYQRILVHTRLGKRQVENYSGLIVTTATGSDTVVKRPVPGSEPEWIVLWSDFRPTSEGEERLAAMVAALPPVATFTTDSVSLAVYRVR